MSFNIIYSLQQKRRNPRNLSSTDPLLIFSVSLVLHGGEFCGCYLLPTVAIMASKYDLTPRVAQQLDIHLIFPLLEFLQEQGLYPDEYILKAKIELLNHTNMVDYAMDIHKSLYHTDDVPQGII